MGNRVVGGALTAVVVAIAANAATATGDVVRAAPAPLRMPRARLQAPQDPPITPQQIARGDSIFRGKVAGGTCFTCHQLNAKGLPGLAPDLTDSKWIHGDGSYAFIVATIQKGVPKPKQAAAPMLPRGGTSMNEEQIRAVAAYVYSLRNAKR